MRAQLAILCLMACSCDDSSSGGGTDVTADAAPDVTADVTADAAPDVTADAAPDVTADAVPDVTADAPQDDGTDTGPTACNALSNIGAVVQQMYVATSPVTGGGGVIATGTYVLTAAAVYTGPDGIAGATGTTFADTVVLSDGGGYERVASIVNDAGLDDALST